MPKSRFLLLAALLLAPWFTLPAQPAPVDPAAAAQDQVDTTPAVAGPVVDGQVRIESRPAGATVWINERMAGQTPMVLPADNIERVIRVKADGYRDITIPLRATGGTGIMLILEREDRPVTEAGAPPAALAPAPASAAPKPPSRWSAFLLSALYPGMGQAYQGRSWAAFLFGVGGTLGLGAFIVGDTQYRAALNAYDNGLPARLSTASLFASSQPTTGYLPFLVIDGYLTSPVKGASPSCNIAIDGCGAIHDGYYLRNLGLGIYLGIMVFNLIEVVWNHPTDTSPQPQADRFEDVDGFYWSASPQIVEGGETGVISSFGYRMHF